MNDDQILKIIDEHVDSEKCEKYDAFVLYIHTHGVADTILCNNSCIKIENNETTLTNVIHFNQITEIFKNDNYVHLINKPKLIFFDFCLKGKLQ